MPAPTIDSAWTAKMLRIISIFMVVFQMATWNTTIMIIFASLVSVGCLIFYR